MEDLRSLKALTALGLLAAAFSFSGCGINEGADYLELGYSYPADGETDVRAFGAYILVFSYPLDYSPSDEITLSFPAVLASSGETLYVTRRDEFIPFNCADTIRVASLTDGEGNRENLDIRLVFRTAAGEREDNSEPVLSDTLRLHDVLDAVTGTGGTSAADLDYFTAAPPANDSFRVTVSLLASTPVFCVRSPGNTCYDLGVSPSVSFKANDTVTFYVSNRYGDAAYNTQGWYRVSMTPLR